MNILLPLPARDFDPTEAAVAWRLLVDAGHDIVFATPAGRPAKADPRMLTGK
ncbi:MAG: type 1 glutamine amidotransferase domain-containing protein, partial [Nannocystaceae bacterium]